MCAMRIWESRKGINLTSIIVDLGMLVIGLYLVDYLGYQAYKVHVIDYLVEFVRRILSLLQFKF